MANFTQTIAGLIQRFGFWGVFGAGILEQIIVPIPSPFVPMGGGFFLVAKNLSWLSALGEVFLKVALPFALGSTLGATMVYLIALKGASFVFEKYDKFFGFGLKDLVKFQKKFFKGKTDEITVFVLMAIPVIPTVLVSAACGVIQISAHEYYLYTFLGLMVRGIVLGWLGWWVGEAFLTVAGGVQKIENLVMILLGLIIFGLLIWGYKNRDKILGRD